MNDYREREIAEGSVFHTDFTPKEEFLNKNRRYSALERTGNMLIKVGIVPNLRGFHYLRYAVELIIEDMDVLNRITKVLYPKIAENFNSTPSKVERAIRHAIEVGTNSGRMTNINKIIGADIFSENRRLSNSEFIALIADKVIMEYGFLTLEESVAL